MQARDHELDMPGVAILQGYCQVVNTTNIRSTYTTHDGHLRARHSNKKEELKLIKHDGELKELKKF